MKKLIGLALVVGSLAGCGGASFITSAVLSSSSATGDGWYVRNRTHVYYCDGKSNTCREAEYK